MVEPIEHYQDLLSRAHLAFDVEELPKVFLSQADAWTVCTLRYLVPVRQRRRWASEMVLAVSRELADPAHAKRIVSAYPRQEVRLLEDWRLGESSESTA